MEYAQTKAIVMPTTTHALTNGVESSLNIVIEKKKRGRKKNSVISAKAPVAIDMPVSTDLSTSENIIVLEKKPRKKRTVKPKVTPESIASGVLPGQASASAEEYDSTIAPIKKRKRRVCKNHDSESNIVSTNNPNVVVDDSTNNNKDDSNNITITSTVNPPEEKVAKKRGRKPKGGKIITQHVNENNNTNDMPNIILHLKCSLSSIKNNCSDSFDNVGNNDSNVESYNSSQLTGSKINTDTSNITELSLKSLPNLEDSKNNSILSNYTDSSMFKVYDPNISLSNINLMEDFSFSEKGIRKPEDSRFSTNASNTGNSNMFNITYSPDINLYSSNVGSSYCMNRGNNINDICSGKERDRDRDRDNEDETDTANINEREIWRKINQLKLSFHKSDICQNIGGSQRSACFWCTCEFDSPAIYIPKSCSKEGYQVYGCFCSPECAAAFLMNENIDTSTRFERYHLLNSVYGKIYKYEKSIKIAPNPYYLLNKYYGNLTIQEYRKLFHSDQMIYVVNKPLTHILPELYEDNNDFLLNTKIIPTHSVNIKKNKPLKSNILNNAFGIH